jgi:phage shock protein A
MHTSIHLHVRSETRALFCVRMLTQTVTRVEEGEIKKIADDEPHTNSVHAYRGEAAQLPVGSGPESSLTRVKQHFLAQGLSVDADRWG